MLIYKWYIIIANGATIYMQQNISQIGEEISSIFLAYPLISLYGSSEIRWKRMQLPSVIFLLDSGEIYTYGG